MRDDVQVELLRELVAMMERRQADMSPEPGTLAAGVYTSRERFAAEREALFRKMPILACVSQELARPGDFVAHDHAGVPILVTRKKDGMVGAFLNVCRHRGALLATEPCGSGRNTLACVYHGWTYDLGGKLCGVPHGYGFPGLVKEERGLVPLAVEERHGLVFVMPTPGVPLALDTFLAPLFEDLRTFRLAEHRLFERSTKRAAANWKLMMDANLETYHINVLHKGTGGRVIADNVVKFSYEEPHARAILPFKSLPAVATMSAERWKLLDHAGVLYVLFPNTVLFFLSGCVHVLSSFPTDVDQTVMRAATLVHPDATDDERNRRTYDGYWDTIHEDIRATEAIQSGFRAGANQDFVIGRFEEAISRFHGSIARRV